MKAKIRLKSILCILPVMGGMLATVPHACAQILTLGPTATVAYGGSSASTPQVWNIGGWEQWGGGMYWNGAEGSIVMPFQLPSLGNINNPFTSAQLGVTYFTTDGTPTANLDLYGLGVRASSAVLASDYYSGSLDTTAGVTLLDDNIITPSTALTPVDSAPNVFSGDLASYLNTAYAGGANAGDYVFLRFSYDVDGNYTDCYHIESNAGAGVPQFTYTAVPEPSSMALFGLASLAMLNLRRRR